MRRTRWLIGTFLLLSYSANPGLAQQIGKYIPIQAGSEVDHAVTEINATTDPAQKLALIDKFAEGPGKEATTPSSRTVFMWITTSRRKITARPSSTATNSLRWIRIVFQMR